MRKYRNIKTGRLVATTCKVAGEQWEELVEEQASVEPVKKIKK